MSQKLAKLIDGTLMYHGVNNPILLDNGKTLLTTDENVMRLHGYKEVVYTEPLPEEGYIVGDFVWEETETQIIQRWNYIEYTEPIEEKSELETRVDDMDDTISMLTECILEMSSVIYA